MAADEATAAASPTNPLPTRAALFTVVVPTLDGGLRFYHDLMGLPVLRRGRVASNGAASGRPYALLGSAGGRSTLRLLQAPDGAPPNRPRPGATLMQPGLAGLEFLTRSDEEAFLRLKDAGVETITPPLFYYQTGVDPLPGATTGWDFQDLEITTFVAYGPGGENVFVSQGRTLGHKPWPTWTEPGLMGGAAGGVLVSLDRWGLFDFYGRVFGVRPSKDQYMAQDACNALIGAPAGTYFHFGGLGDGVGFEWWEYRDRRPPKTPPFPTSLERTGLAMVTMTVPDLPAFRRRLASTGVSPVSEGALPTAQTETPNGLVLRGPLGELIEVIGTDV